jgi:SH3 domain protein
MIQKKLTILLMILASSAMAANYVSNDLFTYTHSGPSSKYKILGTVNAGEEIRVITRNKNTGFTQIRDSKGRSVWINSKYVSNKPGLKTQLDKLNLQYSKLDEQLRTYEEKANKNKENLEKDLNINISKVQELEKSNAQLTSRLKEVEEKNKSLNSLLDNEKNELLMKWFSYGGMVAGGGLLLGLLLPSLIPSKKRSRF